MLALPTGLRPLAIDLRGFGETDPKPVDATRGLSDFVDDLQAFVEVLELPKFHLVGWSMGGGVALQYLCEAPEHLASLTLVAPVSPFGFGGTRGTNGELLSHDGAGSGGGGANSEFVRRLAEKDTSSESELSPRQALLAHYVKPPFMPPNLDMLLESMLSTQIGDDHYPGDLAATDNWPGIRPGTRGALNTMSPNHFRIESLSSVEPKPPILWIRGADDVIVSDTSLYDFAYLGQLGAVPGSPGVEVVPPQPMITQTRTVLDTYGIYEEIVIPDSGHGPHLDQPEAFRAAFLKHVGA